MSTALQLHPDRLFPTQKSTRSIARRLYKHVKDLPIISPHGHTDPAWFGHNEPFTDATELLVKPDHYLFRGTPSRIWLDTVFSEVFGLEVALSAATADHYFALRC